MESLEISRLVLISKTSSSREHVTVSKMVGQWKSARSGFLCVLIVAALGLRFVLPMVQAAMLGNDGEERVVPVEGCISVLDCA